MSIEQTMTEMREAMLPKNRDENATLVSVSLPTMRAWLDCVIACENDRQLLRSAANETVSKLEKVQTAMRNYLGAVADERVTRKAEMAAYNRKCETLAKLENLLK